MITILIIIVVIAFIGSLMPDKKMKNRLEKK